MANFIAAFEPLGRRLLREAAAEASSDSRRYAVRSVLAALRAASSTSMLWQEFAMCLAEMLQDADSRNAVTKMPTAGQSEHVQDAIALHQFSLQFMEQYVLSSTTVRWSSSIFEAMVSEFHRSVERNEVHIVVAGLIRSAGGLTADCRLAEDTTIGRPTRYEQRVLWERAEEWHEQWRPWGTIVRHERYLSRDHPDWTFAGEEEHLAEACRSLRLAVGGYANVSGLYLYPAPGTLVGMTGVRPYQWVPAEMSGIWPMADSMRPNQRQMARAKDLYGKVRSQREHARVAMTRYDYAVERRRPEDRLIDSVIGLEGLLLPLINDELSYRFALHGAWLLGDKGDDRKYHSATLRRIYALRSRLVHGEPVDPAAVPDMAEEALEYLRRVIVKYLDQAPINLDSWSDSLKSRALGIEQG